MSALSVNRDAQGVGTRLSIPVGDPDLPSGKLVADVKGDADVRLAEALQESLFDHLLGCK